MTSSSRQLEDAADAADSDDSLYGSANNTSIYETSSGGSGSGTYDMDATPKEMSSYFVVFFFLLALSIILSNALHKMQWLPEAAILIMVGAVGSCFIYLLSPDVLDNASDSELDEQNAATGLLYFGPNFFFNTNPISPSAFSRQASRSLLRRCSRCHMTQVASEGSEGLSLYVLGTLQLPCWSLYALSRSNCVRHLSSLLSWLPPVPMSHTNRGRASGHGWDGNGGGRIFAPLGGGGGQLGPLATLRIFIPDASSFLVARGAAGRKSVGRVRAVRRRRGRAADADDLDLLVVNDLDLVVVVVVTVADGDNFAHRYM